MKTYQKYLKEADQADEMIKMMEKSAIDFIAMNVQRGISQAFRDDDWLSDLKKERKAKKFLLDLVDKGVKKGYSAFFKMEVR